MKYTQLGKKVDKKIKKYLDTITKYFVTNLPEIRAILLAGGFGRGEGSVWIDEKGKMYPQNDFELFLIVDKPIKEELINKLANEAIKQIDLETTGACFYDFDVSIFANTFYIDAKAIPISKLPYLLPMFRYYELKHSSYLLWGEEYRHLMPDYNVEDFPLTEGLRLLLNRMALLCLYFSFLYLKKMNFTQKHGLVYLGSKSLLDLGGALTQLSGRFLPSYLGRMEQVNKHFIEDFPKLAKKYPELPKIIEDATLFKMKPDFSNKINAFELWTKQKKYIEIVTVYFAEKFFKQKIVNIYEFADLLYRDGYRYYYSPYLSYLVRRKFKLNIPGYWLSMLIIPILNILYFWRILKYKKIIYWRVLINSRAPDLSIFASMLYILYGTTKSRKVNETKLAVAKRYLSKTYPVRESGGLTLLEQWEMLKDDFSNAFLLFSFLKIV